MITDLSGSPINVGDYIVQAFNLGRCAALKYAKVVKVREGGMTVVGCEKNTMRHRSVEWILTRKAGIRFPERSLVIPRELVPEDALELLDRESV